MRIHHHDTVTHDTATVAGVALALGLGIAACSSTSAGHASTGGSTSPSVQAGGSASPTVGTASVGKLGTVLVDGQGQTLYLFVPDARSKPTCTGGCASVWPPLTVSAAPKAGAGVEGSLLGTVRDSDGKTQVTYGRWPLYTYVGDSGPGTAVGQGIDSFGGLWWAVAPTGAEAGQPASTPATTGTSSSSG